MSTLLLAGGVAGIFLGIFLALAAVGVLGNERTGVSKSLAVLEAFSAASSDMRAELEPSFEDRVLAPLLDRTLALGRKLTPADHGDRIRLKLEYAGNPAGWTVDKVTSLKVVGFGVALVLGLLVTLLLGIGLAPALVVCSLLAVAGYSAPNMYLYQKAYDRTAQLQKALPDALDLLTISVEAGLGFDPALQRVAEKWDNELCQEFRHLLQDMRIGKPRREALREVAIRCGVDDLRVFISSIIQADQLGVSITQVLRVQSQQMRLRRRQRAEELAQKAPIKMLFPMVFLIFPAMFVVILGPALPGIFKMLGD